MTPEFLRAEALARAIALLPDPETGPRIVDIPIEPIRKLTTDPAEPANTVSVAYTVRFRVERFSRGSQFWWEYVLDLL